MKAVFVLFLISVVFSQQTQPIPTPQRVTRTVQSPQTIHWTCFLITCAWTPQQPTLHLILSGRRTRTGSEWWSTYSPCPSITMPFTWAAQVDLSRTTTLTPLPTSYRGCSSTTPPTPKPHRPGTCPLSTPISLQTPKLLPGCLQCWCRPP